MKIRLMRYSKEVGIGGNVWDIEVRKQSILDKYSNLMDDKIRDILKRMKWSEEDLDWLEKQLEILKRNKCGG